MITIDAINKDAVSTALKIIGNGGIIIYPTDTIYGFGVDATNNDAIDKLNEIKRRSGPISVLAPNQKTALNWSDISNDDINLIKPKLKRLTTIIFPVKNGIVSPKILGNNYSLGVRIPDHPFCNELSTLYPNPITTTSVNRHGSVALNNPKSILKEFRTEVDLFINSGHIIGNKESSIFKLEHGKLIQLRS